MSLRAPIKKKTLQQTVFNAIRNAILTGELSPGDPISLKEIANNLRVSTMPVRESLRQLEAQGLVTFASQKEIRVAKLSVKDLQELYWVRIALELKALERGFARLDGKRTAELARLSEEMSREGGGGVKWTTMHRRFHLLLYAAEGSFVLKEALGWLWDNAEPYLKAYPPPATGSGQDHTQLVGAVKRGDLERAKDALKSHLEADLAAATGPLRPTAVSPDAV